MIIFLNRNRTKNKKGRQKNNQIKRSPDFSEQKQKMYTAKTIISFKRCAKQIQTDKNLNN